MVSIVFVKIKSKAPIKRPTKRLTATTITVNRITSGCVGQVTFFSSSLVSLRKVAGETIGSFYQM